MNGVQLVPNDTLFFGAGVPFFAEGAQEDVIGVFPPHPPTVVGALRAALARANGWSGRGRWSAEIMSVLGDGPTLAPFAFRGPFLLRSGAPLFAVPRHLAGVAHGSEWCPRALLRPGLPLSCDLGETVRLPELDRALDEGERGKDGEGWWLSPAGMSAVLSGEVPTISEVVASADLWQEERRVGLEIEAQTRTAKEGHLYSSRHVRLARGVGVGAQVDGIPEPWKWPWDQVIPLGGERRLAELGRWSGELGLQVDERTIDAIGKSGRIALIALTPLDLDPGLGAAIELPGGLRGVVVSACVDRPQRIGGWSTIERRPEPLRSVVAPGSTLFCEVEVESDERRARLRRLLSGGVTLNIGRRQAWGFGLVALGKWPEVKVKDR